VFEIFNQLSTEDNQSLLVVTYDPGFTANTNRIIEMEDGRIIKNGKAILF
jgi:lipoprotein-releasing system ATP-binding protein